MFCNSCGVDNSKASSFCSGCGSKLNGDHELSLYQDMMDEGYSLLDAGKHSEALQKFQDALNSDWPLSPRALIGMAEVFERLEKGIGSADSKIMMEHRLSRLNMAKAAFEYDDRLLKLSMMHYHYVPLMWPAREDAAKDPERAVKTQAALVVELAQNLPEDLLHGSIEFDIAEFISEAATGVFYTFDVRIAEAQLHAGFMLARQEDVLENQYKAMAKLHLFLRQHPPAKIGATMLMNGVRAKWAHFDEVLDFLAKCEDIISSMNGTEMTVEDLASLDREIDRLLNVQEFDFFNTYIAFGTLVDQLISETRNQEDAEVKRLNAKYRSWKNKYTFVDLARVTAQKF